jgi:hypothetical protein
MRTLLAGLVASALIWCVAPTAQAEVVTRPDPHPACSQRPALDVKRATFNYGDHRFVWKIKMAALSRKRTQVFGRYTLGTRTETRYDVLLRTKYSDGVERVTGHWSNYETGEYDVRFTDGLTAQWNWRRQIVKFTLTSHLRGRVADAWAYSVPKGDLHGPPCGDYIWSGRISRG